MKYTAILNDKERELEVIHHGDHQYRVRSDLDLSGPETIKTSMPGKVVKVLVEEGQEVEPGTGVIITALPYPLPDSLIY